MVKSGSTWRKVTTKPFSSMKRELKTRSPGARSSVWPMTARVPLLSARSTAVPAVSVLAALHRTYARATSGNDPHPRSRATEGRRVGPSVGGEWRDGGWARVLPRDTSTSGGMARRLRRCRPGTVLDDQSRRPFTVPSAALSRNSCGSHPLAADFPRSWSENWRSTSAAACSRTASRASAAPDVAMSCWWRSPASGAVFVPRAAPDAPATSPRIWWTRCFPARSTDNGPCRSPSGSAGPSPATERSVATC